MTRLDFMSLAFGRVTIVTVKIDVMR